LTPPWAPRCAGAQVSGHLDQVFQALIDRSRAPLHLKTIKTIP
jgi:hypothetical protein